MKDRHNLKIPDDVILTHLLLKEEDRKMDTVNG
jgi:hypothetical protein